MYKKIRSRIPVWRVILLGSLDWPRPFGHDAPDCSRVCRIQGFSPMMHQIVQEFSPIARQIIYGFSARARQIVQGLSPKVVPVVTE